MNTLRWITSLDAFRRTVRIGIARARFRFTRQTLSINLRREGVGFFAQMNACIRYLRYAEENNLNLQIALSSGDYLDTNIGNNWLTQYFTTVPGSRLSLHPINPIYIRDVDEIAFDFESDLSLTEANELIAKNINVLPEVISLVDSFCLQNEIDSTTLGIHYRGTDKSSEAPSIPIHTVIMSINKYLSEHPVKTTVFIASDDQLFIDAAVTDIAAPKIVFLNDHLRSTDGTPVHLRSSANKHVLGLDAIVNCLVLSRCGTLIRSASFLSAWASIFNPALTVILLNKPYESHLWYPEREILKTATMLKNWD